MKAKTLFAKLDPFFFGNRKIMRAGRNGREVFLFALCMNAQRGALGQIPLADLDSWYVAHQLQIPESDARDGVTNAVTAGLLKIDGESVLILGWNDDWSRGPLTRAEIQKNYRERQKGKGERYEDAVTSDDLGNALPIRVEERREERADGNSLSDFVPSQKAKDIATERRLDLAFELAQFRDTAAAKGWRIRDWDSSFCKWLRQSRDVDRAREKARPKMGRGPHVSKQRTADGVKYVLTEADGNSREITEEEARDFK